MNECRTIPASPTLLLASRSPRRADLLRLVGFSIEVAPFEVDETPEPNESPLELAQRLAAAKAAAAARTHPSRVILAADTVVIVDGRVFGKPVDRQSASAMLRSLSDRVHEVITAVALGVPGRRLDVRSASTRVRFARLSEPEIEAYVSGGEPYDKAGGYALQGVAGWFVESVEGSPTNVIGLPLELVRQMVFEAGIPSPPLRPVSPS